MVIEYIVPEINMEKLKQYRYIILIALAILGLAFYWYEWRPIQIRKSCFNTSESFPVYSQDSFYRNCVMGHGIKP